MRFIRYMPNNLMQTYHKSSSRNLFSSYTTKKSDLHTNQTLNSKELLKKIKLIANMPNKHSICMTHRHNDLMMQSTQYQIKSPLFLSSGNCKALINSGNYKAVPNKKKPTTRIVSNKHNIADILDTIHTNV
jgi:hypothetical protein